MKRKENYCYILFFVYLLSHVSIGESQKGRKNVFLIEEIQRTVNLIWSSVEKNTERSGIDWSQKFAAVENNILVISNRIEKIVDSIENNKLHNNFVNEKLDKLESKFKSFEQLVINKLNVILEKVEQIATDVKSSETGTDAKLRKLMNIISDTYQLNKEMTISLKGRQGSAIIGSGDENDGYDKIDELQKKLMEQLSVVEAAILSQLTSINKIGKETLTSFDSINVEMLNLRDECHTQRLQEKPNNRNYDNIHVDSYSSTKNGLNSQSMQCPNVNVSDLRQDLSSKYDQIVAKIENEMSIIESKIAEFSSVCNNNGRSIPLSVPNNTNVMNQMPQLVPERKSINPADRPTGRSGCVHSSDLVAPESCTELRRSGSDCDGVYVISIANVRMLRVYCDMTDNGGGWTVILRRGEFGKSRHRISFDQDWNGYKGGFGHVDSGEFWMGLENIHWLTSQKDNILQVDLESFDGDYVSVVYDSFRIGSESDNYKLHIGNPLQSNTTIAQGLIAHNNSMFTTRDKNNGKNNDNCALKLSAGWWFHNCHSALLTAPYFGQNERQHVWQGIQWHSWKRWHHLKAAQMKIKSK